MQDACYALRVTSSAESKDVSSTPQLPSVVLTSKGGSLADHLDLKNLPLATTPGGRIFCEKALHPSNHEIKSARVPGGNNLSVALCSDQVTTIPITSAGAEAGFTMTANPIIPLVLELNDGGVISYYQFQNAAFAGSVVKNPNVASLTTVLGNFLDSVEKYRITSQSVTVELIAPSLSDQGTITAAQWRNPPQTIQPSYFYDENRIAPTANANPVNVWLKKNCDVYLYEPPVAPASLVLGTQAYTAKAREGVYMPLKLDKFKWKHVNDTMIPISVQKCLNTASSVSVPAFGEFPYHVGNSAIGSFEKMIAIPKPCGSVMGQIAFDGMAANVALRVRVRQVVEITCRPSSHYSPLLEVPLPPDDTALKMYFEVSAKMKDAYPASYNDLGKLKAIISKIASAVGPYVEPALSILGKAGLGPVSMLANAAGAVVPVVKGVRALAKSAKKEKKAKSKAAVSRPPAGLIL